MMRVFLIFLTIIFVLICLAILWRIGEGAEVPKWQIIMTEAVGEGEIGMMGVACCLRNRLAKGLSIGCYGAKREDIEAFCQRQGVRYLKMAKAVIKAVFKENCPDVTFGATHFESTDFPKPKWAYSMQETIKIGKHIFYKED